MVADDRQRGGQPPSGAPRVLLIAAAFGALTLVGAGAIAFMVLTPPRVVFAPAPVRAMQPNPVVTQPNPVVTQPNPVVTQLNPVVTQPKPFVTQPNPVVAQPNPVVTQPNPVVTQPKPVAPPKAVTNEEWLERVFKAKHQTLRACVEQDLRLRPNAPTLYMVTLTFEPDGLPVNSFTQLTPKGSRAVWDCLRMAIFYAINEEGEHNRAMPKPGNFTISLALDFTGAKPAKTRAVGFGDD